MLWLAGLVFLALRKIAQKFSNRYTWWAPYVLLVLAIAALAYAPLPFGLGSIGSIAAWALNWFLGLVGSLIGVSATIIAGVALVLTLAFGLVDLFKDHKPDGAAKWMAFSAPVLVLIASGPIAANVGQLIDLLGGVGPEVVATIAS
ncbi:hypothetical protein [Amycolatopsis arida]|uniref:hypothetical protein n=1 Tax=Amycolatopsis arida TaxID=587909 RepID=UPI0010659D9A|nr:hypothetical protein [Amycolatopsis arida]TDX84965.1 hypothetical protein CLV69_11749 [Amycolatopsis arida]